MDIAPTFREWTARIHGDRLSQDGHITRLLAEEPTFPDDPSWAQMGEWRDSGEPMGRGEGLIVTESLHRLWTGYREDRTKGWPIFKAWEGR